MSALNEQPQHVYSFSFRASVLVNFHYLSLSLSLSFTREQMDEHEQSANEELGASFLLVLHNVLDEGTDFIARELDAWRALGLVLLSPEEVQEEIARGIVRVDAEGRLFFAPEATARGDREAAMMALLDAQFFRKFSGPERVS